MLFVGQSAEDKNYTAMKPEKFDLAAESPQGSDLRIKIEERFQARPQLLFDIFLAALENMHSHVRVPAVR
jgi:hypothetical protein